MRSTPFLLALVAMALPTAHVARAQLAGAPLLPAAAAESSDTAAGSAGADSAERPPTRLATRSRAWSLGAWAGGAPTSYAGHFIGATPGRPIALVGVRLGSTRAWLGPVGVEYVAQLIPAALAYDTPVAPLSSTATICGSDGSVVVGGSASATDRRGAARPSYYCLRRVYGAGAMPLGVQLNAPIGTWVHGFLSGSAGVLVFADNVPIPQARRLNLAFDFGGGVEIGRRRSGALTVGYKLHHISNAWTAQANPGIDHHVLYAGFIRELRRDRRAQYEVTDRRRPATGAPAADSVGTAPRGVESAP